jgi:hypothetical protein
MLSLACGHLSEAEDSDALRKDAVAQFFAVDQDDLSLEVVRALSPSCIIPIHCSVIDILRGRRRFEGLNLVYATGLFDYLADRLAMNLLKVLWSMIAPSGRLVVANFTPESEGRSYMEAFMDWNLIYRDEAMLNALASSIASAEIEAKNVSRDKWSNVAYLDLRKNA